ncbi:MAG: hybrid sensor histidine kinase/response regulator, partial [Chitinophagaceae bacterium]|nr:hybrid sensor histidine kinase/response regulator [Chitinophagaceae bacterium]
MKFTLVLLHCMLSALAASAQSYYFRHYQVENGLSNNGVLCSLHDKQGFLWFGTKDGLNRFDGYAFKIFRNNTADSTSIGSNFIQALYEDDQGIIWAGTDHGLYAYNRLNETFTCLPPTRHTAVKDLRMDNQGYLWFISGFTLCRYHPRKKIFHSYDTGIFFKAVSLCITEPGILWVATYDNTLEKYDPFSDRFIESNLSPGTSRGLANAGIDKIASTGIQSILIGTTNRGLKLFDIVSGACTDIITYNDDRTGIFVRDILRTSTDEFWVATESGLYIYNIRSGAVTNLKKQYNNPYSLSDNAIYTLTKDNEGGVWAGTYFGGINYYSALYNSFEKFFPKTGENSISGNAVREICRDTSGNLWVGTEDAGLNEIKAGSQRFTYYNTTAGKGGLSYSNIHGLLPLGNELLTGTFEHGLDILNITSGKVSEHFSQKNYPSLTSDFIYTIYKTKAGVILLGTEGGLCSFNRKEHTFSAIPYVPKENFIASIFEDSYGNIWVGTFTQGVYHFNPKTGVHGNFRYINQNKNGLSNNRVNGIMEDSQHVLWFATEGGITRYDPQHQLFRTFSAGDGFPSNVIYRSLEDKRGNIWVSTSKGLVCMNLNTLQLQIYTTANGLLSDQFNYNSAFNDNGNLYFGSVKGMIRFNPDNFIKTTFIPPVYITGFQVYDKELLVNQQGSPLKKSITYYDKITLSYKQSSFSLDFAALSYSAPEMTRYMYKMEGLDKEWTYLKSNRKVYFTELSPGTYTFMVKASSNTNSWNDRPTTLIIKISPPVWLSPFAYLAYIVAAGLLCFFLIRNYHLRVHAKNRRKIEFLENEKEKEIYHAKIEFFTNVAHEIKTPLTLIKLPLEKTLQTKGLLPETIENLQMMEKNTNRLIDLTNQLLDFRKTENDGFALTFVRSDISEFLIDLFQS